MTSKKISLAIAATAVAALGIAGCSSSTPAQDTQNANAALCQSIAALQGQVDEVTGAAASAAASGQTVTVGQAQEALRGIKTAWQAVKQNASDLSDATQTQFEDAQQQYSDSLQNIDKNDSLASASGQVQSAQKQLQSSYAQIESELGCS